MACEKRTETDPETHKTKITRIYECKSNFITNYYNGKIGTKDASTKLGPTKLDHVRSGDGSHFHFYSA